MNPTYITQCVKIKYTYSRIGSFSPEMNHLSTLHIYNKTGKNNIRKHDNYSSSRYENLKNQWIFVRMRKSSGGFDWILRGNPPPLCIIHVHQIIERLGKKR